MEAALAHKILQHHRQPLKKKIKKKKTLPGSALSALSHSPPWEHVGEGWGWGEGAGCLACH